LAKFDPVDEDRDWVEIEKGYAACLRLRGPSGALDIFCIYMPTGSGSTIYTKYRKNIMLNISKCICPKEEVLSIMAGDWNFVEHDSDRWCFETGQYTGNKDSGEAEFFKLHLSNPHGFHEWSQDHYTCEAGASRSRIDRMYCNQNLAVQLDRHITCNVLEWDKLQSAHRPLVFSRRSPRQRSQEDKAIPLSEFKREGWKNQVTEHFQYLCRGDPNLHNPLRRLLLYEDAIRNVYDLNKGEFSEVDIDSTPDDKLGYTMTCIKAIEGHRWATVHKCLRAYRELKAWIQENN
jgi:hypothetical protein